jgi:iron(III) transport system substrate-binding protein
MRRFGIPTVLACAVFALAASAADLPKSTQAMLSQLKLSPDLMRGIDEELAAPQDWLDGAKREGVVKILGSWDTQQFATMVAPFKERYPFLRLDYTRGDFDARALNPIIALQQGRYIADVITGFGGSDSHYKAADALEDLRILPNFKNPIPDTSDPDGRWVAARVRYWCLSYNTGLVRPEDLPKHWDDILTNPAWHNGNIGVGARPQLWLLMLEREYGEAWVRDYMERFFAVVKPQLRKEGVNALLSLTIAGEFHASVPAADYRTKQYEEKRAPIKWYCPEPVPRAASQMGILKGNPHPNAARLWVNWFLSKEGQVAQFKGDLASPAHRDLQIPAFLPYPDQIIGHKIAGRLPDSNEAIDRLNAAWTRYWLSAGGAPVKDEP